MLGDDGEDTKAETGDTGRETEGGIVRVADEVCCNIAAASSACVCTCLRRLPLVANFLSQPVCKKKTISNPQTWLLM